MKFAATALGHAAAIQVTNSVIETALFVMPRTSVSQADGVI
jgi:hypothetical protein